jgi:tRNA(Ile)-lysidine synthetase-like protein
VAERLARIAARAERAGAALERRLAEALGAQPLEGGVSGVAIRSEAFERLPQPLQPLALAALHRRAGAPYPAGAAARGELLRQLAGKARAACDCGGGWRWEAEGGLLALRRAEPVGERVADFTYTLEVPGELEVPELSVKVSLFRRAVEPWMFRGSPARAALALPLEEGDRVTVRNRRPGDRIHPLGASGSRRLKEVLVDRRVPRRQRDRLPLLCVAGHIAWVPGVTIDQRFRLGRETAAWVAEVTT